MGRTTTRTFLSFPSEFSFRGNLWADKKIFIAANVGGFNVMETKEPEKLKKRESSEFVLSGNEKRRHVQNGNEMLPIETSAVSGLSNLDSSLTDILKSLSNLSQGSGNRIPPNIPTIPRYPFLNEHPTSRDTLTGHPMMAKEQVILPPPTIPSPFANPIRVEQADPFSQLSSPNTREFGILDSRNFPPNFNEFLSQIPPGRFDLPSINHQIPVIRNQQRNFKLLEQPHEKQRKSYKNENRYLLPNPLVITFVRSNAEKVQGTASVRLAHENGSILDESKTEILEGIRTKNLDSDKKCQFSLKILSTSEGSKFSLCFDIKYSIGTQYYEETVYSRPFKVTSNKKKSYGGISNDD